LAGEKWDKYQLFEWVRINALITVKAANGHPYVKREHAHSDILD